MIEYVKELLQRYIDAFCDLKIDLNSEFISMIKRLGECKTYIILTGVGKSAIIAKKISSTMNSLGVKSFFLHPSEALHGELGQINSEDFILFFSKSGETSELVTFAKYIKEMGNLTFSITGNSNNTLSKISDYNYKVNIDKEACFLNLAPTISTTLYMTLGDIIAICLSKRKGFTSDEFAKFHPGGNLGIKLTLRVKDIMRTYPSIPVIKTTDNIYDCIVEMTSKRIGMVNVINVDKFVGIITDYDFRNFCEDMRFDVRLNQTKVSKMINRDPITVTEDVLAVDALKIMRENKISSLPVLREYKLLGVVDMNDIIQHGVYY